MFRRVVILLATLVLARSVWGQADTGRHRAPRAVKPDRVAADAARNWQVGVLVGLGSSGDLFRVRTSGVSGITWSPPQGADFSSADYIVTLDENPAFGIWACRDMGDWLRLRGDIAYAQLPMTAVARVGESVELYPYDDLALMTFTLALETRLARQSSYPFIGLGGGFTRATGNQTADYDQTVACGRVTVGWQQRIGGGAKALRIEARDTIQNIIFDDYRPPVTGTTYPDARVESKGPQHLVEILVGLGQRF